MFNLDSQTKFYKLGMKKNMQKNTKVDVHWQQS